MVRELRAYRAQQVLVHRPWGTVAAVADRHYPVRVFLTDGKQNRGGRSLYRLPQTGN
jgi:hypothetical protein